MEPAERLASEATVSEQALGERIWSGVYVPVRYKLVFAGVAALAWFGLSVGLASHWVEELARLAGPIGAWIIVAGIALIPGLANAFLVAGLLLDRRPVYGRRDDLPPVTILIAAYNEEKSIRGTIETLSRQDYQGAIEIIVIDDGSTDGTAEIVEGLIQAPRLHSHVSLELLRLGRNGGKARALNAGLRKATHDLIVTVDADTWMRQGSLAAIVLNLQDGPPNTAAVAGTVLVRNSRRNILTRLQEWDYFHGIAVVKRIQSLFQGTLVAQGAFSIYRRDRLEELGGWPETLGEDIVLTWGFLARGYRVGYAENAFVFTNVPETYRQFFRQRRRWSRGLIEAFKTWPSVLIKPRLNTPFILLNLLFPYLDLLFLLVFLPGLVAAVFFRFYAIVGLMTLAVLPLTLLINGVMFVRQRRVFTRHGLKVRKNVGGLLLYMLVYQVLMVPASVAGYAAELFNARKTWGTK
jgi:biofilm PGA synthesis N-glycosyltransferase PgaC